jgi:hypothetical protein
VKYRYMNSTKTGRSYCSPPALEHRQYLVTTFKDLADCDQSLAPG